MAASSSPAASAQSAPAATQGPPTSLSGPDGKPLATPAVRRVAREHGVQLAMVSGSGKGGRILKSDVLAFIESRGAATGAAAASSPQVRPAADHAV